MSARDAWADEVRLLNGRLIVCHFAPLFGGATIATFRPTAFDEQLDDPLAVASCKMVG
jgi:hypothetical protein